MGIYIKKGDNSLMKHIGRSCFLFMWSHGGTIHREGRKHAHN